jgi:hypothetical protein
MTEAQDRYFRIQNLLETAPDFLNSSNPLIATPLSADQKLWLGRAYALIKEAGDKDDTAEAKRIVDLSPQAAFVKDVVAGLFTILYRALAVAELKAPASAQGAFIAAGNPFDALNAFSKILSSAKQDVLLVDPYMDEKALTDFAVLIPEKVPVRLLADQHSQKPSLRPAVHSWIRQYRANRPLEARLSSPRSLHDRLIVVDKTKAWALTQSLNAFAARSPASIILVNSEIVAEKIQAYEAFWNSATAI